MKFYVRLGQSRKQFILIGSKLCLIDKIILLLHLKLRKRFTYKNDQTCLTQTLKVILDYTKV